MSQKHSKISVRGLFRHFFDTPGREARERLFETFWGFRGSGVWRLLYIGIAIVMFWLTEQSLAGNEDSWLHANFPKARLHVNPHTDSGWTFWQRQRSFQRKASVFGLNATMCCQETSFKAMLLLGSVPTTPDPNTSAKVSRYKWEAYRDTNWWCIYYFLPQGGHTFAKVCHRNGRCIAILFHMYRGQGSIWLSWSTELWLFLREFNYFAPDLRSARKKNADSTQYCFCNFSRTPGKTETVRTKTSENPENCNSNSKPIVQIPFAYCNKLLLEWCSPLRDFLSLDICWLHSFSTLMPLGGAPLTRSQSHWAPWRYAVSPSRTGHGSSALPTLSPHLPHLSPPCHLPNLGSQTLSIASNQMMWMDAKLVCKRLGTRGDVGVVANLRIPNCRFSGICCRFETPGFV